MRRCFLSLVCACLLVPTVALADNNMRDYVPAPAGTLLNLGYYFHISGDQANANGHKAADVDFDEDLALLREVYYFNLGRYLAAAQIIVPFGRVSLDAGGTEQDSSGLGDIMLFGTVWLVNQPENKLYLAFSPYFFLPTGAYDDSQSVNMGANRWAFRGEVNLTKGFEIVPEHNLYLEVTTGFDAFSTNKDYLGDHDMDQDAIYNLESHISYDLTKTVAASVDYYGHWGGAVAVDNANVEDSDINTQTLGGTLTWGFAPGWQGLLQYRHDVHTRTGVEAQVIQARIFYAFDLGLASK